MTPRKLRSATWRIQQCATISDRHSNGRLLSQQHTSTNVTECFVWLYDLNWILWRGPVVGCSIERQESLPQAATSLWDSTILKIHFSTWVSPPDLSRSFDISFQYLMNWNYSVWETIWSIMRPPLLINWRLFCTMVLRLHMYISSRFWPL